MTTEEIYEVWLKLSIDAEKKNNWRMVEYCCEQMNSIGLMI